LSQYEDGLKRLLEAQSSDASFMAAQKFFVEPGESKTLTLNRAEKAKWIAIVAGYYNLAPDKVTKVFEIPVKVETKGLIRRKRVAEIQPLHVDLILGPHSIQEKKTK
jgi:predicted component of type VI protein secretion system